MRLGLGMRPDLTGRGLAQPFIEAGLDYARREWRPRHVPALGRALERAGAARVPARRLPRGAARRGEPLRGDGAVGVIRIADEVREALAAGGAVVALETTLVAHGFPPGEGVEVGLESERQVRAVGRGAGDGRRPRRRGARRADGGGARAASDRTRGRPGRATSRPPRFRAPSARRPSAARSPLRVRPGSGSWPPAASAASIAASRIRPTSRPTSRSSRGRPRSSSRPA